MTDKSDADQMQQLKLYAKKLQQQTQMDKASITKLQKEIEERDEKIINAAMTIKTKNDELNKAEETIKKYEERISEFQNSKTISVVGTSDTLPAIGTQQLQSDSKSVEMDGKEKLISSLYIQIDDLKSKLSLTLTNDHISHAQYTLDESDKMKSTNTIYLQQKGKENDQKTDLQAQLEAKVAENAQILTENKAHKSQLEITHNQIVQLEQKLKLLDEQITHHRLQNEKLTEQLEQTQQQLEVAKSQVIQNPIVPAQTVVQPSQIAPAATVVTNTDDVMMLQNLALKNELEALKLQMSQQPSSVVQTKDASQTKKPQNESLKTEIKSLQAEIEQKEEENQKLTAKLLQQSDAIEQVTTKDKKIEELTSALAQLKQASELVDDKKDGELINKYNAKVVECSIAMIDLNKAQAELMALNERRQEVVAQNRELQTEVDQLKQKQSVNDEAAAHKNVVEGLNGQLGVKDAAITELQGLLASTQAKISQKDIIINQLTAEKQNGSEDLKKKLIEKENALTDLNKQLDQLRAKSEADIKQLNVAHSLNRKEICCEYDEKLKVLQTQLEKEKKTEKKQHLSSCQILQTAQQVIIDDQQRLQQIMLVPNTKPQQVLQNVWLEIENVKKVCAVHEKQIKMMQNAKESKHTHLVHHIQPIAQRDQKPKIKHEHNIQNQFELEQDFLTMSARYKQIKQKIDEQIVAAERGLSPKVELPNRYVEQDHKKGK